MFLGVIITKRVHFFSKGRDVKKFLTLSVILLLAEIAIAQDSGDPGIKDTVSFCNVEYYVASEAPFSGQIKIEIWLYNDSNSEEFLSGVVLPLRWTGPVHFDSFSFLGTKAETLTSKDVNIDNTDNTVLVYAGVVVNYTSIIPGKGKLVTLMGTVQDTGVFILDTVSYIKDQTYYQVCFTPIVAYCFSPVIKKLEFRIRPDSLIAGDVNQNGQIGLEDIICLVNYIFRGERLFLRQIMDVNANCVVNLVDLVFLVNYIWKSGPQPVIGCACY